MEDLVNSTQDNNFGIEHSVMKKNGRGRSKGSGNKSKNNKNFKATRDALVLDSNSKRKINCGSLHIINNSNTNYKKTTKNNSKNGVTAAFQENP